jgi:hypothetical protein
MTDIMIERGAMEERLDEHLGFIDEADRALAARPSAPDGGIASEMIGFIARVGGEAAGLAADTHRALTAIALDVINDLALTDEQVGEQFLDLLEQSDLS